MAKESILVVDNDAPIRRLMRISLGAQGFEVHEACSGDEALECIRAAKHDLIILDINLPGLDGIQTCREIRTLSDVPIIVLTVRAAEKDKTEAFESGADDFMTKPFSMPELLARIRSSFRKRTHPLEFQRSRLRLGDVEIDFKAREIRGRKQEQKLTPKEFALLSYMAAHANRVVTHQELLHEVWGSKTGCEKEYLRVFMNHLRKKIENTPDDPQYLLTEYWLGYRLRLPA